jgi:hypothetical protein
MARARGAVALLVAVVLACAACGVNGLQLERDTRVHIDSPRSQSKVTLPVSLSWHVTGDLGRAAHFAIFIDREPMPPGKDVHWLGDTTCKRTPGCPDADYLSQRYIYLTTKTSLTLDAIPLTGHSGTKVLARDFHEVTIVLLDNHDRRFDEAAYSVDFSVRRTQSLAA